MIPFTKYLLIVYAFMTLMLGVFYGAVMVCNHFWISPFWAAVPYVIGFVFWIRFEMKHAYDPRSEKHESH